jgi:hypothetical protein
MIEPTAVAGATVVWGLVRIIALWLQNRGRRRVEIRGATREDGSISYTFSGENISLDLLQAAIEKALDPTGASTQRTGAPSDAEDR